jgi:FMN-dependent NADH-azoreductase
MKKLLVINSSPRSSKSKSRELTEVFLNHWKNLNKNTGITLRDLSLSDVPFVTEEWIEAGSKRKENRSKEENEVLKISDSYIAELKEADIIVLSSPMYNWSIPAVLKAYIDQIVRINETWKINRDHPDHPYIGLLENKTVVLLLSRGGTQYEKDEANEYMNFQSTYLKTIFKVIGISNIHMITVNGESMDQEKLKITLELSHKAVKDLIESEFFKAD